MGDLHCQVVLGRVRSEARSGKLTAAVCVGVAARQPDIEGGRSGPSGIGALAEIGVLPAGKAPRDGIGNIEVVTSRPFGRGHLDPSPRRGGRMHAQHLADISLPVVGSGGPTGRRERRPATLRGGLPEGCRP